MLIIDVYFLLQIRKYIIQAQVLRDSWPLSKSAWDFVAMLKNLDRLDVEGMSSFLVRSSNLIVNLTS